jgi:3-methyladenine DNA glycosylase AlkD
MDNYIFKLKEFFKSHEIKENQEDMAKYMRNKFKFLGLKSKKRRELSRVFYNEHGKFNFEKIDTLGKEVWNLEEREFQYIFTDFLKAHKKKLKAKHIELLEYLITHKSWWDTVDIIAKHLVGELFKNDEQLRNKYLKQWIESNNIWLQRTTLLFQLGYKEATNETILYENILRLKNTEEFFIDKAIGWALREYSKVNSTSVKKFIDQHNDLSTLSIREASKYL